MKKCLSAAETETKKYIAIPSQSYLCHKVKAADRYIEHKKVNNKLIQYGGDAYLKKKAVM